MSQTAAAGSVSQRPMALDSHPSLHDGKWTLGLMPPLLIPIAKMQAKGQCWGQKAVTCRH